MSAKLIFLNVIEGFLFVILGYTHALDAENEHSNTEK